MIASLKKIFGEINASENKLDLLVYSSDASRIEGNAVAVVFPTNIEDVQKLVRFAKRFEVPLVPRGAGTNDIGSCVPENAIVVDMSKMNKILEVGNDYAIVEAGVLLKDLNRKMGRKFFPIDSNNGECTVGGMIASNAFGNLFRKYGRIENWIIEMEVIDGTGKYEKLKEDRIKHFAGLEGCTGIIINAVLKLTEKPGVKSLNLMGFNTLTSMMETVSDLLKDPNITFLEYWDESISSMMDLESKNHLLIEYDNDEGDITDTTEIKKIWDLRDSVSSVLKTMSFIENEYVQIPIEKMDKYLFFLKKRNVPSIALFGPNMVTSYLKTKEFVRDELIRTAHSLGGNLNIVGTGIKYKKFFRDTERIIALKDKYDPKNLMNRGKLM